MMSLWWSDHPLKTVCAVAKHRFEPSRWYGCRRSNAYTPGVFATFFKSNFDSQAVTAFGYPFSLAFEWHAWRQLKHRILAGEFDIVLRVLPMTPVIPSPFAFFLRKGPIPFVIGPLNGGLRSAPGFNQPDKKKEWMNFGFRRLHRFLPFARSTYRHAAAIIAATSHMRAQFGEYHDKLFFVPENGIARSVCLPDSRNPQPGAKLELIFVGGFVRRKACYLGLRAAAPLLRMVWRTSPLSAMVQSGAIWNNW